MSIHPDKTAARAVHACGGVFPTAKNDYDSGFQSGHESALAEAIEAVGPADALTEALLKALLPFANLGVTSGPDDEPCALPYRITRGSIRSARAVCDQAMRAV